MELYHGFMAEMIHRTLKGTRNHIVSRILGRFVQSMPQRERKLRQPHRDQYEIIKQILQTVYTKKNGCRSFELTYRCELS